MSMNVKKGPWSVGRPPKPAWYYSTNDARTKPEDRRTMVRWWTGSRWSVACHPALPPQRAAYYATLMAGKDYLPYWAEIPIFPGSPAWKADSTIPPAAVVDVVEVIQQGKPKVLIPQLTAKATLLQ